jgi:hypothetical protein
VEDFFFVVGSSAVVAASTFTGEVVSSEPPVCAEGAAVFLVVFFFVVFFFVEASAFGVESASPVAFFEVTFFRVFLVVFLAGVVSAVASVPRSSDSLDAAWASDMVVSMAARVR